MPYDRQIRTPHPPCLVTGGNGFIGRHLVASLRRSGADVLIAVRPGAVGTPVARHVVVELGDREALSYAMRGVEVVYHLAGIGSPASPPEEYSKIIEVNVEGTLNVLLAAADAGVRRVVMASSASVYGSVSSTALSEEMKPRPVSVYGASKLAAEHLCTLVHQSHSVETIALRYFSVYGPGEDPGGTSSKLIPVLVQRLSKHQPITLYGDGGQTRDFIHVDDVVNGTILAGTVPDLHHDVINLGSGKGVSVADVVRIICERMDTTSEIRYEIERPSEVRHSVADIKKARTVLGFEPAICFSDGIVAWLASHAARSTI